MPFSAFAQNITITPTNASKTYGQADPVTALQSWFSTTPAEAYGEKIDEIAELLTFIRLNEGENVGTYGYTLEADNTPLNGHYLAVSGSGTLTIKKKDLSAFDGKGNNKLTVAWKKKFYTSDLSGGKFTPTAADFDLTAELEVFDGKLVAGVDFDVLTTAASYGTNNAKGGLVAVGDDDATNGTNYITIQGKGNYSGTTKVYFKVEGANLADVQGTVKYNGPELVYKGSTYTPLDFDIADFELANCVAGTDFIITKVSNATNAGTATITLGGIGAYAGEKTVNIDIKPLEIKGALTYALGTAPVYTGRPLAPVFSGAITYNGLTLTANDYEISDLATNASTATYQPTFKISFKRNFTGEAQTLNYDINPFDLSLIDNVNVEWNEGKDEYEYNGDVLVKPAFTLTYKLGGTDVYTLSGDFVPVYQNNDGSDLSKALGLKKLVKVEAAAPKSLKIGNVTYTDIQNFVNHKDINKTYTVVPRKVEMKADDIESALGISVTPVTRYTNLGKKDANTNQTPENLGLNVNYTFSKTGKYLTLAQMNNPATEETGVYDIIVSVTSSNPEFSNYTFVAPKDADDNDVYGKLTKIANEIVVKLKDRAIGYGDALPQTGWAFEHVSGLSQENSTGANFAAIIGTPVDKFALVNGESFPYAVNANGYAVNFNGGKIESAKGYTITVQPAKLYVTKKNIKDLTVEFADATYTGKAINPIVTIKQNGTPISTSLYTVEYDPNFGAGNYVAKIAGESENYTTTYQHTLIASDPEVLAGTNTVGQKVTRNYFTATYTIKKKALTITPDDFIGDKAWKYGTDKTAFTSTATITGLVDADASKAEQLLAGQSVAGFNGKLNVQIISTLTIGEYAEGLQAKIVNSNGTPIVNGIYNSQAEADAASASEAFAPGLTYAANNYYIVAPKAKLKIDKGALVLKVKDVTLPYMVQGNNANFNLEVVSGMDDVEELANFNTIVSYSHAPKDYGYVFDNCKDIKTYTLAYSGAAPTATNYNISLAAGDAAKGTLTVTKRPLKIKAKNQTRDYGNLDTDWNPAVTADYVEKVVEGEFLDFVGSDDIATVIESVKAESLEIGENKIILTAKASNYYDITLVPGILTITSTGAADIVLNRVDKADVDNINANTALRYIEQRDGQVCNVSFSDFALKAEKWYPLVLPFATSVKEISEEFGYAVVDVLNETSTDGNIHLKLHMGNIAANTPFIVKVFQDINMKDVEFKAVRIVKGEPVVGDANGIQFIGTYTGKADGFRSNQYYFSTSAEYNNYYKGNDTNQTYLRPLGAYFQDNAANAVASSRTIFIEESNGETTAISAIAADGSLIEADGWYSVNGVKMQSAPTKKGVYVRNGKKVVIK